MSDAQPTSRNPWAWIPSLYLAQGLPFAVVNTMSVIMYKSLGISNTDIAFYTAWLYLPWVIKPLWSPMVDILKTRRLWIWATQLLLGAGFAAVGLSLPLSMFFKATLVFFYLVAFSSATHDIAADGFYMLALNEKQQAFFVGVRSTFFRISMITGQGLLVILAGYIQTNTGLPNVMLEIEVRPGATVAPLAGIPELIAPLNSLAFNLSSNKLNSVSKGTDDLLPSAHEGDKLRIILEPSQLQIAPQSRKKDDLAIPLGYVSEWNASNKFIRTRQRLTTEPAKKTVASWWSEHLSAPLEMYLREHFPRDYGAKGDIAGNIGVVSLRLSKPPGKEIVVTPAFKSGDKSVSLAEGSRLVFDDQNWNKPAFVVFQLDPKLQSNTAALFEIRSGNIPLSWTITFAVLVGLFLCFGLYHRVILPYPASDQPGSTRTAVHFIKKFFLTFGSFFTKSKIGVLLLFLLLYRFGEAQLVKMVAPFLLDAREVGGLGLTTRQVGLVYGTIGIIALTCGGLLGGIVASRHGLKFWLWPMVLAIHLPDAMFIYLAYAQSDNLFLISAAVAVEQFGYGFGFTAYMLYMIYVARGAHKTAHYAICTGFMALGMMLPGMWSGWLEEIIGYHHFFVWVILATIPSFLVVLLVPLDPEFGKRRTSED